MMASRACESLVDLLPSDVLTCVMLHVVTPLVATLPRSRVQVRIESLADCCFTLVSVVRTSTSFRDAVNRRIWNALVRLNEPPVHLDWNVTYAHRVADAEFMRSLKLFRKSAESPELLSPLWAASNAKVGWKWPVWKPGIGCDSPTVKRRVLLPLRLWYAASLCAHVTAGNCLRCCGVAKRDRAALSYFERRTQSSGWKCKLYSLREILLIARVKHAKRVTCAKTLGVRTRGARL